MRKTLVIENVDLDLLKTQVDILIDLLELTRDDDAFMDVTPLDGIVEMLGDQLPLTEE
jgi:hypothetical protein